MTDRLLVYVAVAAAVAAAVVLHAADRWDQHRHWYERNPR